MQGTQACTSLQAKQDSFSQQTQAEIPPKGGEKFDRGERRLNNTIGKKMF